MTTAIARDPIPTSAYRAHASGQGYESTPLTRGPWHPSHQHAGPPIALACRALEQTAAQHGLTHMARLTANLLRPVPIATVSVEVSTDYAGRNAGHFSARLVAADKEVARFTALFQREAALALPADLPGHPLPQAPQDPDRSPAVVFPFAGQHIGYSDLVETRSARGQLFRGPCAIWFRLQRPLMDGEPTSPYQRVAVAADSGNGISAILDIRRFNFVNSDLTINLLRPPVGEWICLEAQTWLGSQGGGLAESRLYDTQGLIGRATQSLAVRAND
jgi:Thioesterase-like superfamily